jgi:DNA-binding LacI/PurR family transcriptional regulator
LIDRGHQRIGFVLSRYLSPSSEERRKVYYDMLTLMKLQAREEWLFYDCFGISDGVRVVQSLLRLKERPTALLVGGDQVA